MELIVALLALGIGVAINILADSLPYTRRFRPPHCHACTAPRSYRAWLGVGALLTRTWYCPYCGTPRTWRVPLVEAATALSAVCLYRSDPMPISFWPDVFVMAVFLLIVVIDIEHRLILHVVTGPAALILGLIGILDPHQGLHETLIGGLVGFAIVLGLYLFGWLFSRLIARSRGHDIEEVAFGFGDVTLAGLLGLTVGRYGVLVALFLGILAAGEFSLVYMLFMLVRRRYQAFQPIPYGPFLVFGTSIVYFGGETLVRSLFPYGPLLFLAMMVICFAGQAALERIKSSSE